MSSIFSFIIWYLVITILGWITFPITYRLLPGLPDRGYSLTRALGLLLWGSIFWQFTSFGILQNNLGGVLLALFILVIISIWAVGGIQIKAFLKWMKSNKVLVLMSELVFMAAFSACAFIRAANPNIVGTEKPMELAFINAILRSPTFPPSDPWFSGYAISYYYFGYIMVSVLIRLTGIESGIGYNLAIGVWFAMTALGAYGLIFNLLKVWRSRSSSRSVHGIYTLPILGPIFILIVSNLEGILDVLHSLGLFWHTDAANMMQTSTFWHWLNIAELSTPPPQPYSFLPTRPGGVVWWRASRVVQDFKFNNSSIEIIDEFPFFSYLLGDLHPHVLAMPFALLAIALALNLFLVGGGGHFNLWKLRIPLGKPFFFLTVVTLGGLAFINTWDFPIYLLLFCGTYVFSQYLREGWRWLLIGEFIYLTLIMGIASVLSYFMFYIGFQSQAGGILPSVIFSTRGVHFWVMFAPLLLPILIFLFYQWKKRKDRAIIHRTLGITMILLVDLLVLSFLYGAIISLLPKFTYLFNDIQGAGVEGIDNLLLAAFLDRLREPGTWITLGTILAFVLALLHQKTEVKIATQSEPAPMQIYLPENDHVFVYLLILLGALITLFPEYFYLRDQFGNRMNTIFKFYSAAWIIWGLAASYSAALLLNNLQKIWKRIFQVCLLSLLAISFVYPIWGLWTKTNGFQPSTGLTLDGNAYLTKYDPDKMAAITWLLTTPYGVVAEAVGGQYSDYGWVSEHTGLPAVLGWPGHESEWGRHNGELEKRADDLSLLYQTNDWKTAQTIIQTYNIKYIMVSDLERSAYQINDLRYKQNLFIGFQQGYVTVYEIADSSILE